ncbi:MAG TPA: histidine--tRNA ligase [Candidatus Paceibacterota bacterium]|nr:histidine--tRNA ligase [Candidatus Paceibacterota bacterium]
MKTKKEVPTTVKGMRDIYGDDYYRLEGFMEKASEIAMYYGFTPIETPILENIEVFTSGVGEGTDIVDKEMYELKTKGGHHLVLRPEGTAAIMRSYIENGMQSWPHPVMLYYKGPLFRHESPQRGRYRQFYTFGLEALGSSKSIMDATIIHTTVTILHEAGIKNLCVEINSIGSKESREKYTKELISYYRKHLNEMPPDAQKRLKKNPLRLLDSKDLRMQVLNQNAPDPLGSLLPADRQHFKEVLEYLEMLEIPYRINNHLVRGLDYYSRTVFEVFDEDDSETASDTTEEKESAESKGKETSESREPKIALAAGGRYDYLADSLGHKKSVPGVGAGIGVDRILGLEAAKKLTPRIVKKPKVFFIQLGFEAKLKSLKIIEILRKAKIPIMQTLNKDSLSAQLGLAEKLEIPYTIIFGQKECMEDNVLVRNMQNHSQDTIKIENLREHLKTLK